ncbi:unnamed protein product [Rhizophagus irregularis]|nr:unnamed protein product [Rhizophagus irregularis]
MFLQAPYSEKVFLSHPGCIHGTCLGEFRWEDPAPVPPEKTEPSEPPELEAELEAESEGDSDYDTANEGETPDSESDSENDLCVDHLVIIPETYQYREDPLAMFEDIEDQIRRFHNPRIDQDIAFPSEILDTICQDRIDQTVSRQYHEILDKIDEMERNQHSGWIYEYGIKIFLEISAYQPFRGRSHFALPKIWAKPQLGIINPQNTDERCFEACLKAYLASEEARRQGTRARNLHDVGRL